MKNVIRAAALWLGGILGFSACLIKGIWPDEGSLEGFFMLFCGIATLIGFVWLIADPLVALFRPNEPKKDDTNE